MYGINLVTVARVLATPVIKEAFFGKHGAIKAVYEEIIKFSAEKNIEMVRVMMRTLARQNEKAYNDMLKILHENFTDEELEDIIPN
jgi:hypothetical protein